MSAATTGSVRFERDAGLPHIAQVTLRNPERMNAMTRSMWRELRETFDGIAEREPELRAIIVRGADARFCAGAQIDEFPDFHFEASSARAFHEREPAPALGAMLACDIPLIAQIEGVCIGGGLEIAACCDIRIAGAGCRFGVPIAKLGFPMAPDEMATLLQVVARSTLVEMLLEARLYDGRAALQRGLVHRVVPDGDVAAQARSAAQAVAALPALPARINKQTLRQLAAGALGETERAAHYRYAATNEHREAVLAFLERRL